MDLRTLLATVRALLCAEGETTGVAANGVRNALWLAMERFIRFGCQLAGHVIVARSLGLEGFGRYQLVLTGVLFLVPLVDGGLDALTPREVARPGGDPAGNAGRLFRLRLLLGLFGGLLLFLGLWGAWGGSGASVVALIAAAAILPGRALEVLEPLAQVTGRVVPYAIMRGGAAAFGLAAKGFAAMAHAGLDTFLVILSVESVGGLLVWWLIARRSGVSARLGTETVQGCAPSLLREGFPLALSGFLAVAYTRLDHLIIGWFAGAESVGIYGAAVQLLAAWGLVPMVLYAAATPALTPLRGSPSRLRAAMVSLYRFAFVSGVLASVLSMAVAGPLLREVYGGDFADGVAPMRILSLGLVFSFVGVVRTIQIVIEGLSVQHLYAGVIATCLNVFLSVWLVPILGLAGAAWSTVAAGAMAAVGAVFLLPGLRVCRETMLETVALRKGGLG